MKIGIIGCGFIARQYAQDLQTYPELELVAAADLQPEKARALGAEFGGTAYATTTDLLARSPAQLILNLTIHPAHAAVTRQCLQAGRHVYSEKPLALAAVEAEELVDLAAARGLALGCAPGNWLGDVQRVTGQLLAEGRLGPVRMVYAECNLGRVTQWNSNPEPFLRIGPLFDGAVYPLTLLVDYFGPVRRVLAANALSLLSKHTVDGRSFTVDTPDQVTAVLEMASGTAVRLSASMYVPYQTKHFYSMEFHGDVASLYLRNCGDTGGAADEPQLEIAPVGEPYRPFPLPATSRQLNYASPVAALAAAIEAADSPQRGQERREEEDAVPLEFTSWQRPLVADGARAAHLVAVIEAINRVAAANGELKIEN